MSGHRRDGRRRCPACRSALVNVQGLADCPDCRWTDANGDA
ncbi:hypothetical protein [Natronoarchaeum rubrum]|nr:hypothetical protein [Natronoarchaeum rubrum]